MQEAFLKVNGLPTKVITWGKWVEENFSNETKNVILCIPGNPGITKFYETFLETIHEQTGYPVWIVGHAGHENPKTDIYDVPPLENNEHLYSLQGQVDHKVAFIEKYIPKNVSVHLIGHSIGSYIVLNLLKNPGIRAQVAHSYLLFPTIEYMAESMNGFLIMKFLRHISFVLFFLTWFFNILPETFQIFLVYIYCKIARIPTTYCDTVRMFIDPYVIRNFSHMGMEEMYYVRERDNEVLKENKDRMKLYYCASDNWIPLSYYKNIKNDIPGVDAELSTKDFDHAFVLRHSKPVGNLVTSWIKEK